MWLKGRRPGPYTAVESGALVLALASLIGLPQAWLWQNLWLFTAFWMLTAVAVVQIRTVVCHACKNVHCPLRSESGFEDRQADQIEYDPDTTLKGQPAYWALRCLIFFDSRSNSSTPPPVAADSSGFLISAAVLHKLAFRT